MTDSGANVAELIALIDRLEGLLERSDLSEIELETEGRTLVLRSPQAVLRATTVALAADNAVPEAAPATAETSPRGPEVAGTPSERAIEAPLTGVFYRSPTPDADAYVSEGDQVAVGQVIGLIEAMKLFNEIKSDSSGAVRRLVAADGELVKAGATLIELEPS